MGRKGVANTERKRGGKGIRFIGDMGFAMEEILFNGARLFHHPLPDDFHFLVCFFLRCYSIIFKNIVTLYIKVFY